MMNTVDFPSSPDCCSSASLLTISSRFSPTAICEKIVRWLMAICAIAVGASPAWGQTVSIGAASFTSESDQISADWYWPMPSGVVYIYEGYGAFQGMTRTETYTAGQRVAGIKTVKWHLETKSAGTLAPTVEDWWLAIDSNGNLRVIEIVQSGSAVFVTSGGKAPPIYIPVNPAKGQSWDFLGNKLTIKGIIASQGAGFCLTLGVATPDSPTAYETYSAGLGLTQQAVSPKPAPTGTGWRRRTH